MTVALVIVRDVPGMRYTESNRSSRLHGPEMVPSENPGETELFPRNSVIRADGTIPEIFKIPDRQRMACRYTRPGRSRPTKPVVTSPAPASTPAPGIFIYVEQPIRAFRVATNGVPESTNRETPALGSILSEPNDVHAPDSLTYA